MRIGINGFFFDKPATGSGQYVINLVRELKDFTEEELLIFCPSVSACQAAEQLMAPRGKASISVVPVTSSLKGNLHKLWFEYFALPLVSRHHKLDLLHIPYFGPPPLYSGKLIVTIHDLIMVVLPQHRGSAFVRLYTALAGMASKRADLVLADSKCTKNDIVRLLGIPPHNIEVVCLACGERFHAVTDETALNTVRNKYGLEGNFILYIGGLDWRKNVTTLIRAFAEVSSDWQLVIAGEAHSKHSPLYPNLKNVVKESNVEDRVKFLGFVAEEDKPALYSLAGLFVFPSFYEGFGLTPLEAMACGAPVLCSNAASLPEVVGDAGLLFDPNDERGLAQRIKDIIANHSLRQELREHGIKRASTFSWRRTAEETLSSYRKVLAK